MWRLLKKKNSKKKKNSGKSTYLFLASPSHDGKRGGKSLSKVFFQHFPRFGHSQVWVWLCQKPQCPMATSDSADILAATTPSEPKMMIDSLTWGSFLFMSCGLLKILAEH